MDVLSDSPDTNSDVVFDPEKVLGAANDQQDVPLDSPCADSEQVLEAKGTPNGEELADLKDSCETDSLDGHDIAGNIERFSSDQKRERLAMTLKIS